MQNEIALYRTLLWWRRHTLANEEMMKHYTDDPSDPFRALWLYIIQHELTPEQAKLDLQKRYESRDEQWGWVLVAIMPTILRKSRRSKPF